MREVVILKTLGATRRSAGRIFSVEFLTLGVVAGLMGALLASVFSRLLLNRLLDAKFSFDWRATVVRDPWTQVVRGLLMRRPGAGNQVQVIVTREGRAFLAAYGRAVISKSAVQS